MNNQDRTLDKFFVRFDNNKPVEVVKKPILKDEKIKRDIYFEPSYCPLITLKDSRRGTCFENLYQPTGSFDIVKIDQQIQIVPITRDLSLQSYIELVYHNIERDILNLYQTHQTITLLYSGGIDSMVLLSYLLKHKLMNRTRIICFKNNTAHSIDALNNNKNNLEKLEQTLKTVNPIDVRWFEMGIEDVIDAVNNGTLNDVKCYTTSALVKKIKNEVLLCGHHGNQVLLHKNIFLDEILLAQPNFQKNIENYILKQENFYTATLKDYKEPEQPIGIEHQHFLQKPWDYFSGVNGNIIVAPIGSAENFILLRRLHFKDIHPDTILNAEVARQIIKLNECEHLEMFLFNECTHECDNLNTLSIAVENINPKVLEIDSNFPHHSEGLEWLMYQRNNKNIPINTLVSFKTIEFIKNNY